jgi:hydroxymethylpyrimidine pyrophosphatase-like HAD family hydrolase
MYITRTFLSKRDRAGSRQCPHLSVFLSVVWGIDKGASVKFFGRKLNILQSEVIAVGNAGNDLSMIEYAGLGVWVDNVDALR